MPTYEYECTSCGYRFEKRQAMNDLSLTDCPECKGDLRRLISGGTGFLMKDGCTGAPEARNGGCSLEEHGKTCCGRDERCGASHCGK